MAEHSERVRVGWIDTDAGGRIHFTVAFRWAETAETGLYRKLGLLDEGRGDYPRRHVEADYLRVLVFDDEVEVRIRVESVGRTSIRFTWEVAPRRRDRDHGRAHDRPRRRRRPADADRRPDAASCSPVDRVSRNLILSPPRRTRRATGIPTRPGGRSIADEAPGREPSPTPRPGRAAPSPGSTRSSAASGRCSTTTCSSRPRSRPARSATSSRSSTRGARRSSATRRSTRSTGGCSTPTSRASGWPRWRSRSGATPARWSTSCVAAGHGGLRRGVQPPVPDARALPAARAARTTTGALINDWSRRVDEVGGQSPPGSPERIAVGEELRPYMTRADRGAPPRPRRRRRQLPRPRRPGAAAARRRAARRDRDDVHLGRPQHDDERDRERRAPARPRPRASERASARIPGSIPAFAEEVVRIDAPQQAMRRIATTDTELGGRQIAAGDFVWLVFGSANLDPARSSGRPSSTSSGRRTATSASGAGIHQCIGAPLARLEVRVALEELLARTSSFRARRRR